MSKTEQVQKKMIEAMKARDTERKDSLSLLLAKLKGAAKDKREALTEEEENTVILKEMKETQESIEKAGGRQDIVQKNTDRLAVLSEFAPKFMSEDEIRQQIEAVLAELNIKEPEAKQKGQIMKKLMPRVKGKADGKLVNGLLEGYFKG
ncbi:MAG: GatB/YqeY domain-containing protein [Christensenellaceae bacterium]